MQVNDVATLVTQATLLVFGSINLACFVLRVSSSPNFRPSFRLFNEWTALAGLITSFGVRPQLRVRLTATGHALL